MRLLAIGMHQEERLSSSLILRRLLIRLVGTIYSLSLSWRAYLIDGFIGLKHVSLLSLIQSLSMENQRDTFKHRRVLHKVILYLHSYLLLPWTTFQGLLIKLNRKVSSRVTLVNRKRYMYLIYSLLMTFFYFRG